MACLYFTLTTQDTTTLLQWNQCFEYCHCRGDCQFIIERRAINPRNLAINCSKKAINPPNLALNCIHHLCAKFDHNRGSSLGKSSCVHLVNLIYTALGTYNLYAKAHFRVHLMDRSWKFPGLGQGRLVGGWQLFWTPMPWPLSNIPPLNQSFQVLRDCRSTCKRTVHMFFFFSRPAATLGGCGCHVCFSLWWNYLLIVLSWLLLWFTFLFSLL